MNSVREPAFFDTVMASPQLGASDSLAAVVVIPAGCEEFEKVVQSRSKDTLVFTAFVYGEWAIGSACAHGSVLDTVRIGLEPAIARGAAHLRYFKGRMYSDWDSTIVLPVSIL
jgi:hypothetical protein